MLAVPYSLVASVAAEYGAIECCWRESDHAFTGFVAEVWFSHPAGEFAHRWAKVIGYGIRSRSCSDGPARYMLSIPVILPGIEP